MAAGQSAFEQNDLIAARDQFEAALVAARQFPSNDPRIGLTLNNLATVYNFQGDFAKAEPLLTRAREIWKQAPPPGELHLATTLHNLAGLYFSQGRFDEVEPLLKLALEIREKALPADHPALAKTRKSMATLRRSLDQIVKAKQIAKAKQQPSQSTSAPEPDQRVTARPESTAEPAPRAQPRTKKEPVAMVPPAKKKPATVVPPVKKEPLAVIPPAKKKPAAAVPPAKTQTATTVSPTQTKPTAPTRPTSGFAIHLASLRTVEGAQREWTTLERAHPDLLQGLKLNLVKVDLGDRGTFQRVVAGPLADRAIATALCRKFKAKEQYCAVVKP